MLSLVNNYESFGGKKQYVDWARIQGQYLTSNDDFFRNPVIKGYYKNHIKTVLNRYNIITGVVYKNDPTIMAWELMNEPRCTSDSGFTMLYSLIDKPVIRIYCAILFSVFPSLFPILILD